MLPVGEYLEGPDLGRAPNVSSATQLAREAVDLDDAHEVTVLLTEEHYRAEVARLLERGRKIPHRLVLGYLLQGELLDAAQLVIRYFPRVTVIEAQPVGSDVATRLHHVLAEHRPQGPVQDVRRRVIRLYLLTAHPVDGRRYRIPLLQDGAAFGSSPQHLIISGGDRVDDLELAVLRGDPTPVGNLPATRGVEGVLGKHDEYFSCPVGHGFDGDYPGLYLLALVAHIATPDLPVPERGDDALVALHGLPGPLTLRLHGGLKSGLIERQAPLGEYLARHFDRESIGVVQHEGHITREMSTPQPLYLGSQERHPRLVDLDEPGGLGGDDAPDVIPRRIQLPVEVAHVVDDHLGETGELPSAHAQA